MAEFSGNPIASAPIDGTVLLLWNAKWTRPMKGYWDGREWLALERHFTLGGREIEDPTHWLPLAPQQEINEHA